MTWTDSTYIRIDLNEITLERFFRIFESAYRYELHISVETYDSIHSKTFGSWNIKKQIKIEIYGIFGHRSHIRLCI